MIDEPTNVTNKEIISSDSEIVQENNENPIPEENPSPTSPSAVAESSGETQQEPTEPALENKADLGDSRPSVPVEELGADGDDLKGVGYDNIPPPEDSILSKPEKTQENQASSGAEALADKENEPVFEPVSEPEKAPELQTPQIPVNEALPESEPRVSEAKEEPKPQTTEAKPPVATSTSFALALLVKARNAIQFRKRRKLDRIMSLFLKHSKITNDEVEKFLHVSDATATRYLSILEKENKIKQSGKTGKSVFYIKI